MSAKIRRFTRARRQYQAMTKLQRQGGLPAGVYGNQIHGLFGEQLTRCRRRLAQTCSSAAKGRCLTTVLALRAPGADPAILYPTQTVDTWLKVWRDHPDIRPGVRKV